MLQFMGSQRVGHNRATELNWSVCVCVCLDTHITSHFKSTAYKIHNPTYNGIILAD